MITATITKNNNKITGFELSGHADYADEGSDIVCAAVSAMSINTVNSIASFTEDKIECSEPDDEEGGYLKFSVSDPSDKSVLLLNSFELGLVTVMESYGEEFLEIIYLEEL